MTMLPTLLDTRFAVDDDHLVVTRGSKRNVMCLLVAIWAFGVFASVPYGWVGPDAPRWFTLAIIVAIATALSAGLVIDFRRKSRPFRVPLVGLRVEVKDTETRSVRHMTSHRTLALTAGDARWVVSSVGPSNPDFDRLPEAASDLRKLARVE
ncbi:MAG: hypothetical protein RMA76_06045 [Deltaproteobacteria bacterium]|jgi:hypothetical protein